MVNANNLANSKGGTMSSVILNALGHSADELSKMVQTSLQGGNGGELFMTGTRHFSQTLSNGILQQPSVALIKGGSVRRINGQETPFVVFDGFAAHDLKNALDLISKVPQGQAPTVNLTASGVAPQTSYYTQNDAFEGVELDVLQAYVVDLLREIDSYGRQQDTRVVNVDVQVAIAGQDKLIVRADGRVLSEYRPKCQFVVNVVLIEGDKKESSSENFGLPFTYTELLNARDDLRAMVDRCIEKASNNLTAIPAKGGDDFEVVFGPGFSGGVVLHEAVGHGFEGDFHSKNIASFQGKIGERVAAKGVTVYEDGTVANARGSYNFDDEGNAPEKTLLIDDGIMVGLINDELSAAALNMPLTGNGRRESYKHKPMPRMSNTYMEAGNATLDELIGSVKKGYYVMELNGGQVDIVSSKFVQNGTVVREINNGQLGAYVKGVSVAGKGNESYKHIIGVANDFEISKNGMCGKEGQSVPVTAGQGSMLFAKGALKVGGSA